MPRDPDNMSHPPPGPGPADPVEAALGRLQPTPPALDRDRLMFQAGAESRRAVIRLWQLTAGLMAAVGFFAGITFKPPAAAERVHPPSAAATAPATGPEQPAPETNTRNPKQ